MSDIVKEILRVVSSSLQIPTIIILILLILLTILMLGSFVAEIFTERRALKINIPGLVDQLQGKNSAQMKEAIENSDLLNRQKESCRELINRGGYTDDTREALARQLIADEEIRYGRIVKITDLVSRVAPMFGLMGTLIPLGPGLIALGQGDTSTLSSSLLIAFDTTVAGLISGAISYVISGIRKNWYEEYMIGLETIMETILDVQSAERDKTQGQINGQAAQAQARAAQAQAQAQINAQAAEASRKSRISGAKAKEPRKPVPATGAAAPTGAAAAGAAAGVAGAATGAAAGAAAAGAKAAGAAQAKAAEVAGAAGKFSRETQPEALRTENIYEEAAPEPVRVEQVSPTRETLTQPIPTPQKPSVEQMSRDTQTQAHNDSKTEHTMVQRTFQEEVRAAEQAMIEAQMRAEQGQAREALRRPDPERM